MKGNLFIEHYSQLENRLTEAFLKVLKHATPELIDSFLQYIHIKGKFSDYIIDFQTTSDIQLNTYVGVLLCIAETKVVIESCHQEVAADSEPLRA